MQPILILLLAALLGTSAASSQSRDEDLASERSSKTDSRVDQTKQEQITVMGSKYLRPNSKYHVLINLANSQVPATFDLQLLGAPGTDREQTEAKSVLAHPNETQTVEFEVGDWPDAEYFLTVNAQAVDKSWLFKDETKLEFRTKTFSGFIQTDRATYKPGQQVQFRVLFLTQTLRPFVLKQGEINVTVEDPARNVIGHWPSLSNYRGLLSLELPLSEDPMLGDYTIRVSAKNQEFSKKFTVAEYVLPTYEVSIQLPDYATYNESNIVATVKAIYTYGKPVKGHVTLTVQPLVRFSTIEGRPMEQAQYRARLQPDGSADFAVNLVEDVKLSRDELFEREMEFFALVEEDSTSRKYNSTKTIKIHHDKFKVDRLGDQTIKPGLPKLIRYRVAYQDGLPVENDGSSLELTYRVVGETIQSETLRPVNGIVKHWLNVPLHKPGPGNDPDQTWAPSGVDVSAIYRNKTHYLGEIRIESTKSQQHLQIGMPQLEMMSRQKRKASEKVPSGRYEVGVGDKLDIQLSSTEPIQDLDVTCQGLARGDIAWALSKRVPPPGDSRNASIEFQVEIIPSMVPQMTIVCFYVRPSNKELIADSVRVGVVDKSTRNTVRVETSSDVAKPGQELGVQVITKPNSLVGILAVDQSSLLLKSGNDLNSEDIMNDLKSYGGDPDDGSNYGRASTKGLLESSDVVVLTNNLMQDGHGYLMRYFRTSLVSTVARLQEASYDSDTIRLKESVSHEIQPPEFHLKRKHSDNQQVRIRTAFPETWIWLNATVDTNGMFDFFTRVPDTITSWQLSAFSMNENFGLALNSDKKSVRVFRPFFIKLNLPYSIIRKEIVSIQAMIFNYSKRPMSASVTMDNSRKEFHFVEASNSIGDERSLDEQTSATRYVELPPNEGVSVSFLIEPVKLGYIDVKVVARGDLVSDGLVRKLLVKAEGQTQHFNKAMLIKLKSGQEHADGVWRQNISLPVPANAVEGSQKVFVSAIGDILGAGLSNIDDLLRLPYGCGEQNMINLVPNIVIMNYLSKTNRLRDSLRDRAKRNIQIGYQRELKYKRSDGSFSAFGQSDDRGSVWLTAYVLKTFQQARSIITVDQSVIEMATSFLVSNWLEDGSIAEVGMLHHKALASKSLGDGNKSLYLTAYTLIALMQQPHANGTEQAKVLESGLAHLEQRLVSNGADLSTYDLAIVAYALELSGRRKAAAERAYEMLWARAIENSDDNHIHWSNTIKRDVVVDIEPAPIDEATPSDKPQRTSLPRSVMAAKQQVAPPLKSFNVNSDQSAHLALPDSLDVEITSFALLTAIRRNELDRSLPIVRWLVANQNSLGGYSSTQDTVLAIEALANYAEASVNSISNGTASPPAQSIEVELVHPRDDSNAIRKHNLDQLLISRANSLVQQQTRLPDNITWVQIRASGVGLAVVQVSWQYNLMVSAERPAFYLNPTIDSRSSTDFLQLSVCTYYKGGDSEDKQAASNMAVAEIELPSGYVADTEALNANTRDPLIKRIETPDGETKVLFYLDKVTRDEMCLTVPAHRSSKVANNQPVPVTIYDYYKRDQAARVFYRPPAASSCDICESDSCSQSCKSDSAPSGKLFPLHEQRRQRLQAISEANGHPDEVRDPTERSGRLTNSTQSQTPRNFIDAYKLLPMTSAFSAINDAAKHLNTSSLHI